MKAVLLNKKLAIAERLFGEKEILRDMRAEIPAQFVSSFQRQTPIKKICGHGFSLLLNRNIPLLFQSSSEDICEC
jgi:hypothetical protein